jgi:hypothetical protein
MKLSTGSSPKQERTHSGAGSAACLGAVLLDLRNALRKAEQCRQKLLALGYSRQRWQEIINDVEPELRFVVRPKVLDAIIVYLRSIGQPISRELLVRQISTQGVGPLQRIRQAITANINSGKLIVSAKNNIGLPEWSK